MKPDVVLVFAYGSDNSSANFRIAHKAQVFAKMGIPIFMQRDVPCPRNGTVFFAEGVLRARENWKEGQYVSTLDVIRAFECIAWRKGWRKVLVLAAPQHMKRCLRDARRRLVHPQITQVEGYRWTLPWIWYDVCSGQWYTQGPVRWWFREGVILSLPWKAYVHFTRGRFG